MKSRAAILVDRNEPLRLEQIDIADPAPKEVRVRMEACGVCRSDLHAIDGNEDIVLPAILGHEGAGVVDVVGGEVHRVKEGDRVILSWSPACGVCPPCSRGEVHLCREISMSTGGLGPVQWAGKGVDRFMRLGAFAEHVIVPERMAIPFTGALKATHACLIGCGVMTGFGAATKTAAIREGESIAILGCGGVGLAAVQAARVAGASLIIAVDPVPERRDVALRVGATIAVDSDAALAAVAERTVDGIDVAVECVGSPQAMLTAFGMIRPGGRTIVVGLPQFDDVLQFPAIALLTGRSICGSVYGSAVPDRDFPALVALHERGQLDLGHLVSKVRPFGEINDALADMREGKLIRVVLTF